MASANGLGDMFGVHGAALQVRSQRMGVLASNIANAATPGFKARDIDFTQALSAAQGPSGIDTADFGGALKYRNAMNPSLDGNTVELSSEQTAFAENAVAYQTTLSFLNGRISTLTRAAGRMSMSNQPMTIFQVAGRAMSAQLVRMNTTASNLANVGGQASSADATYKTMKPVFRTHFDAASGMSTVDVERVVTASETPNKIYDPSSPNADQDGNVFVSAVDETRELVDMMETARNYQNNVEVMQTAKSLIVDTLKLGR